MEKKVSNVDFLDKLGPYSHIVEANGFIFLSGMVPVNLDKNVRITDNVTTGTELVLSNIKQALESVGSGMDRVVKVTVFLNDMANFNEMNAVYKTYFPEKPPARSCVAVKSLPGNFPIEIEVIAVK